MLRGNEVGLSYNGSTRPALVPPGAPVFGAARLSGEEYQDAASISAIAVRASPTAVPSSAKVRVRI